MLHKNVSLSTVQTNLYKPRKLLWPSFGCVHLVSFLLTSAGTQKGGYTPVVENNGDTSSG